MTREKLVFASIAFPSPSSETNIVLLVESLRAFAGVLAQAPIMCFFPEHGRQLSANIKDRLNTLNTTLIPFTVKDEHVGFPFTDEVQTAAHAESRTHQADVLVWLSPNTLVLQEPRAFLLQRDKSLGFRPVHHTLISSRYDETPDLFWTHIYRYCNVPEDRIFPMVTHVDNVRIRPYFNAGMLITRPEKQLLQTWRDAFFSAYQQPVFQEFYKQDLRYTLFLHQAILSGVILSTLKYKEIQELSWKYNYPLHLHSQDITDHRPSCMEELITVRHESFHQDPTWIDKMPAKETLRKWIAERIPN